MSYLSRNDERRPRQDGAPASDDLDCTKGTTPWEPSAWFRDAEARRLSRLDEFIAETEAAEGAPVVSVVGPLGGQRTKAGEREDRTCDRCRVYVPPTHPSKPPRFFVGAVQHLRSDGVSAFVTFGLCSTCWKAEGSPTGPRRTVA